MKLATLEQLNLARRARAAVATVTDMQSGEMRLVAATAVGRDPLADEVSGAFRTGASGTIATAPDSSTFLNVYLPPPRLVLIGAVHIAQALAPMAALAGFDVTIIDPRTGFANADRFGDAHLIAEWPEEALPKAGLDQYTALAALSHVARIDDEAIVAGLGAGCFYVGALGSRRTHAERLRRLRARGLHEQQLALICAPIGLPIGARSPGEIAVAIMAQVVAAWRGPKALQDREVAA